MLIRLWMYVVLKSLPTKMNKICQENMFIKYLTITKTKEDALLKEDIQKEDLHGDTVEMVAPFQQNGIKANRIMQTVLAADFVTVGSPVWHKQDNATIVKRLDTSRKFVK